jgi:hypothetical protein
MDKSFHWPHKYLFLLGLMAIVSFPFPHTETLPTQRATTTPAHTVLAAATGDCTPPYTGVWRTPIPANAAVDAKNAQYIATLTGPFGSDVSQFTMPVYRIVGSIPLKTMTVSGVYSDVTNNGNTLTKTKGAIQVPVPVGAKEAAGSDAQIIFWNQSTGDEYGFWQVKMNADGSGTAVNGYHYNTKWSGVPPTGFGSRGAGVPYLTGLVMPCEITQGHIDHPVALAYQSTSATFVYPATKSDGTVVNGMPEGAHLQLDPGLTAAQIEAWGCTAACLTMAKAMQQYGLIIIDKAGHPKVYAEYEGTAQWGGVISANTVAKIPYSAFRVLAANAVPSNGPIPTPSVSSGPSNTPAPTTPVPTVPSGARQIGITVFLHGIGKGGDNVNAGSGGTQSPLQTTRIATVSIFNAANQPVQTSTVTLQYNPTTGNFTGTISNPLPAGSYTAQIQIKNYLKKTVPGIITIPNPVPVITPMPPVSLVAGDSNSDNTLSILDYNLILDCFSDLSPARNCADSNKKQATDLTDDGAVNQFDYNLFLRELSVQTGQ